MICCGCFQSFSLFSELISGMKVDDEAKEKPQKRKGPQREATDDREYSRADNVRRSMGGSGGGEPKDRERSYQRVRRTE